MTDQELEELIADSPTLYHMAERGSWESIKERGLLSTSALLEVYSVPEPARGEIERRHRPESVEIERDGFPRAVIRDQIPMSDSGLRRCLPAHLLPEDWYALLNTMVFFWLNQDRLCRLTGARAYRHQEHDVLEVDTRSLVDEHSQNIWLCPMNSGCTKPVAHPRDESIFARINDYPYKCWRKKRPRGERVVELAVDYSVPDVCAHVRRVVVMQGTDVVSVIE